MEPIGVVQVPGADGVDEIVHQGMGARAQSVHDRSRLLQRARGAGPLLDQRRTEFGQSRSRSPRAPFKRPQHGAEPLQLPMKSLRVVEYFLGTTPDAQKYDGVQNERQQPVVTDAEQEIGKQQPRRRKGQRGFSQQERQQAGMAHFGLENGKQTAPVDIGFIDRLGFHRQSIPQ